MCVFSRYCLLILVQIELISYHLKLALSPVFPISVRWSHHPPNCISSKSRLHFRFLFFPSLLISSSSVGPTDYLKYILNGPYFSPPPLTNLTQAIMSHLNYAAVRESVGLLSHPTTSYPLPRRWKHLLIT